MANRSTASRDLPRDVTKLAALSAGRNPDYNKVQQVMAIDFKTDSPRLDGEGKTFLVKQVLPDYDRMLRLLFKDAQKNQRAFKNKRLARELDSPRGSVADTAAEAVASV
jgi:hypothetical protein